MNYEILKKYEIYNPTICDDDDGGGDGGGGGRQISSFVGDFPQSKIVVAAWKIIYRICDRKSVLLWLQNKTKKAKKKQKEKPIKTIVSATIKLKI